MNDKFHGGGLAGRILRVVVIEVCVIYCMNVLTIYCSFFFPFKKRFLGDPWPENAIISLKMSVTGL